MFAGHSDQRRRHRSLIDVIQDLEQENAAEVASSGVSPASERPVPLDLTGAISDPLPEDEEQQHEQQQASGLRPHQLQRSEDGSEAVACPPGDSASACLPSGLARLSYSKTAEGVCSLGTSSVLAHCNQQQMTIVVPENTVCVSSDAVLHEITATCL